MPFITQGVRDDKFLSDSDCHKYVFYVAILEFNIQFVYVKCVTYILVYCSLEGASSYART